MFIQVDPKSPGSKQYINVNQIIRVYEEGGIAWIVTTELASLGNRRWNTGLTTAEFDAAIRQATSVNYKFVY